MYSPSGALEEVGEVPHVVWLRWVVLAVWVVGEEVVDMMLHPLVEGVANPQLVVEYLLGLQYNTHSTKLVYKYITCMLFFFLSDCVFRKSLLMHKGHSILFFIKHF